MSTEIDGTSRLLCPACDHVAADTAVVGQACAACGTQLIRHVEKSDDLIGTLLDGRFQILDKLGHGGMGQVYLAVQKSIGRQVAVKMIDRQYESDLGSVKRFMREAKLASQLAHPNTISVIEFGQAADGRLYLVLELVRGRTLDKIVDTGGPQPAARVARIGVQLCDALEAAHALGIIHRDLKLENVMVLDTGRDLVKVLDFGLALSLGDRDRATATGLVAGTPRYLAPEIVDGAAPSPAQDLYALGVVLGEMATGRVLWEVTSFAALFGKKLDPAPTLDGVEPRLKTVILQLISPDPAKRPAAAVVRSALLAIEEGVWLEIDDPGPAPDVSGLPNPMRESRLVGIDDAHRHRAGEASTQVAAIPAPPALPVLTSLGPKAEPPRRIELNPAFPEVFATTPLPPDAPSLELAPAAPPTYELEPGWQRPRETPAPMPRRSTSIPAAVFGLAFVGAAVVGAVLVVRHLQHPSAPAVGDGHGVSIRITAPTDGVAVMIDGHKAGVTPMTLSRAPSAEPMLINATIDGRMVGATVIPDHDQRIELRAE